MKKIITLLLALALTLQIAPCASAKSITDSNKQVQYMDDGSYIVTTITELPTFNSGIALMATTTTKTKSKTTDFYNASNVVIWSFTVTGTFTYGNGSSKCTAASSSGTSYSKYWVLKDKRAWKNLNTAYGSITASCVNPITPVVDKHYSLSLSCSSTGVFS